jgi:hypothetical protein
VRAEWEKGKTKNEIYLFSIKTKRKRQVERLKKKKGGDGKEDGWPPCAAWLFIIVQDTHTHERERRKKDVCARKQWRRLCLIPAGEE